MEQMCMRFFLMRVNFFFQMHHYVQEAVLIRTNDYSFSIFFIRVREKDLVRFFFYNPALQSKCIPNFSIVMLLF